MRQDIGLWHWNAGRWTRSVGCLRLAVFHSVKDGGYVYSITRPATAFTAGSTTYSALVYSRSKHAREAALQEVTI